MIRVRDRGSIFRIGRLDQSLGSTSAIAIYRQLFFVLPGGGPGLSFPSQRMKAQKADEIHKGLK
jgi:hypothetical protein